ncbi:MAG: tRNA (adenosine(37)-N6)-dimethylallyltransferase MiaA, partial [Clostridia bacterium]|nr:tRNA (adenosine(37)-N6)-dimethylallyltransferase MiaA [Clostridia bacterium]
MKTFIGITGTTCVGKSEVAVELAKLLNTQVISADSMQIYKGMDIGTAKITKQEMDGIAHWMLDIVEPNQDYSAHLYQQQASKIIHNMDSIPFVAGGTG